jgi:hypothetical protein
VAAVAALLALLLTLALTAPRLERLLPGHGAEESGLPAPPKRASARPATREPWPAEKRINVKLYFENEDEPALTPEDREISYAADLARQTRTVVEELIKGSSAGHLAPLPKETRVLGVFVTPGGTAYVDLSKEATTADAAGSIGERLAVYALVDSITANFPAIRRVQILVEDRAAETLSGHLDLSRPLSPDMTLVAIKAPPLESPSETSPEPKASPAPPAGSGRQEARLPTRPERNT